MSQNIMRNYFVSGKLPRLRYITNQVGGKNWIDRPLHSHTHTAEINIILKGTAIYSTNGSNYELAAGDIVLCNPGTLHEIRCSSDNLPDIICLGLTDFKREKLPENHLVDEEEFPIRICPEQFTCLRETCRYLYDSLDKSQGSPVFTALFYALFVMIFESNSAADRFEKSTNDTAIAQRAKQFIELHITDTITLEDIAKAIGCSAPYLSHTFKK